MIFIDSSVLIAYEIAEDSNHGKAVKLIDKIAGGDYGKVFTSDYVFDETVTITLVKSKSLENAVIAGNLIKDSINLLKVDQEVFEDSWGKFQIQKTSRFSFTDCTILSLLEANAISNLATFDKEFKSVNGIKVVE